MTRVGLFIDYDNISIELRNRKEPHLDYDVLLNIINREFDVARVDLGRYDKVFKRPAHFHAIVRGRCYLTYDEKLARALLASNKEARDKFNTSKSPPNAFLFVPYQKGIEPVYVLAYYTESDGSKSLCDPVFICDAMDVLCGNHEIDVFVLVTSDKDFLPLIRNIAGRGKEVAVIGFECSKVLREECDRLNFKFFDYLVEASSYAAGANSTGTDTRLSFIPPGRLWDG